MAKIHPPEQHELSNGIPVILQHYDGPVAATYWWVKAGSGDEKPAEAGFAHFLEHMLFKDAAAKETGKASSGQLARAVESMGGDINAYTSFDQTVYHVTCAAQHWEKVIDVFGGMAKPQRFLKSDFEREREVILEELRKNEDSPGRQLFQKLFSATFKKHPYGKPVIGYVKTLNAASVGTLEAFYRRQYVSGQMGLIMVGPIEDASGKRKAAILKLLEKRFGRSVHPKRAAPVNVRATEAPLRGEPDFTVLPFDVKTPTLSFAFRVPALDHEDVPALDLLSGILGMGELSRLYQRLFYQKSLVNEVSGGLYVPRDPGMIYFQAEMDSLDKVPAVAREMFAELKRIAHEGPTDEELARVVVSAESERLYATQTADGMAGRLGFLKFIMGDLEFDRRFLEEIKSVTAAKIQEVAGRYLTYARMSGALLVPLVSEGEKKYDFKPIRALAKEMLSPEKPAAPAIAKGHKKPKSATALPVDIAKLPSGIRVCFFERPQSHVFSAHACVLGGLRLEIAGPAESAERDWGSSNLMSLTWAKGTHSDHGSKARNARDIAAIVEGSAAGLDGFSGRNTVGLQMTGLSRDWGKLSDLFTDVLLSPSFSEEEVGHSRRVAEDSVRSIEDHTSQLCSKLFLETLFEKHPYGKLTTGSLESLAAIDGRKLKKFHEAWVRPERLVIAVSGSVPRRALDAWLKQLEERAMSAAKDKRPVIRVPGSLPEETTLKAPRWVERSLGREQTHILVGSLGTRIDAEDRFALRLLQTLLGGQSGRLFIELREKKSLAYTVAPTSFEGVERGYAGTYIACSPGKRQEAIDGIRAVLEQLAAKGPTSEEMSRAKEFFLGRRAMDLQSDSAIASHFGLETLYGIPHLSEDEITALIRKLTAKDLKDACRKYLVEPFQVTSVVG
jgi:zinc protease